MYALVTTGEALRPQLTVTRPGPGRWDLADSPFALCGDEHFARLADLYAARDDRLADSDSEDEDESWVRLASMAAALGRLDAEGLFGTDAERAETFLLVTTAPPDHTTNDLTRGLNPPGPLLTAWQAEAAESDE